MWGTFMFRQRLNGATLVLSMYRLRLKIIFRIFQCMTSFTDDVYDGVN